MSGNTAGGGLQVVEAALVSAPTPTNRRPRAEDCARLTAASLRPQLTAGASACPLPGGQLARAVWLPLRGCFGGRGRALLLRCPCCERLARVLWRPPLQGWGCWRCRPVSHPSHRRPGARAGRRKPASWSLQQIEAAQRDTADRLGLVAWPPERLIWRLADLEAAPRRPDAPRLSLGRELALLARLDALESLRVGTIAGQLQALGGVITGDAAALMARALQIIGATRWASRRPAGDSRYGLRLQEGDRGKR